MAIERVKIKNYKKWGEKVVEWALHPDTKPSTLAEFKRQTAGFVEVPARIKTLEFYGNDDLAELVIKLPNKEMVEESIRRFQGHPEAKYPVPPFYKKKVCQDAMPNINFLYSRIGDYTIAQCM